MNSIYGIIRNVYNIVNTSWLIDAFWNYFWELSFCGKDESVKVW